MMRFSWMRRLFCLLSASLSVFLIGVYVLALTSNPKFRRQRDNESSLLPTSQKVVITSPGPIIENYTKSEVVTGKTFCSENPSSLAGRITPSKHMTKPEELAVKFKDDLGGSGHFRPEDCVPLEKVAILIPYRDRWTHLHTLLPVLIPMLMRQKIEFTIYVIEQTGNNTYNKGLLFNAGFLEAQKVDNYDCFVLHDVDMIPLDDRNMYRCNKMGPVHFSPGVNKFNYSIAYPGLYGGVVSFTRDQFQLINGASNMYFGWGAEDDDLRDRAANKKLKLLRKPLKTGVYDMLKHERDKGFSKNPQRLKVYSTRRLRQDIDGLNSAVYNVTSIDVLPLYHWLKISMDREKILETIPKDLRVGKKDDLSYYNAKIEFLPE